MEPIKIRCSDCKVGHFEPRILAEKDMSALLGIYTVLARNVPGLHCTNCEAHTLEGTVIERIATDVILGIIAKGIDVTPAEARYLRQHLYLTREEMGERLGVSPEAVAEWETGRVPPLVAHSLRLLAALRLLEDDYCPYRPVDPKAVMQALRGASPKTIVQRDPYIVYYEGA